MLNKLSRTLRLSRHPAGYPGKCALRDVSKLNGHLRFSRPSPEDLNFTRTISIVEQNERICMKTFAEHRNESVTIPAGCPWWAIANNQFEGLRQPLQRRIVPPKVAVVAKWSEANVSFRNTTSPQNLNYLSVPFWHMFQRPGFYASPSSQPPQQYGCQSTPAFENRTTSSDGSICDLFEVIGARCETLISPPSLQVNEQLPVRDFTDGKTNKASQGATKSKIPYRLPGCAFYATGNQRF